MRKFLAQRYARRVEILLTRGCYDSARACIEEAANMEHVDRLDWSWEEHGFDVMLAGELEAAGYLRPRDAIGATPGDIQRYSRRRIGLKRAQQATDLTCFLTRCQDSEVVDAAGSG